jgi:DNA-binding CsgD family transcriptional regulator
MARQGRVLHENEVSRIVSLLASTDMTIKEIADRFGCSRSAVTAINRKFQVRLYLGRRSSWAVSTLHNGDKEASAQ